MKPTGIICLNPWDPQAARIYDTKGVYHAICACAKNSGLIRDGIVYAVSMDGKSKADAVADISNALTVPDKQSKVTVVVYDARGNGRGGVSPTLTGDHQNRITDYTAVVVENENEANT